MGGTGGATAQEGRRPGPGAGMVPNVGQMLRLEALPSPPGRTLWVVASFSQQFRGKSGHLGGRELAHHPEPHPCRFYEKVRALHQDPGASVDNPLLAFSLIKRLSSDWPHLVHSDEAAENTRGTAPPLHLGSGGASQGPLRPPLTFSPSSPRWFRGGAARTARSRGPGGGGEGVDEAAGRLRAQRQGHGQRRLPAHRHRPPAPLQPRPPRRALRRRLLPRGQGSGALPLFQGGFWVFFPPPFPARRR